MIKNLLITSATALLAFMLVSSHARPEKTDGDDDISLCVVAKTPSVYEGKIVSMVILAEAALHEFDIFLSDPSCPDYGMFLISGNDLKDDSELRRMISVLYPGYPEDDGYSDVKVRAHVKGKVVRIENRGLLMTYLELKGVDILDR